MTDYYYFLSGAAMFGAWVCGVQFLKFWLKTRERLFFFFGTAFWFMALERIVLMAIEGPQNEVRSLVYLIRLAAFLLILYSILDKNRSNEKSRHASAKQ